MEVSPFFSSVLLYIYFTWFNKYVYCSDNITDIDSNCQLLYTYGYGYRQYFHLPESSYQKNGSVVFNFFVMASSDAHILLSESSQPQDSDPVYEVVIGAGKNSFSDIRRLRRSATRATISSRNILSGKELRRFWIKIDNGLVTVRKGGVALPFLTWRDVSPLSIRFISFCTWAGVAGKWAYDCKGDDTILVKESTKMTDNERLKKDLLSQYDPYALPTMDDDVILIDALLHIDYINLDAKKSSMHMQGKFKFSWFDPKMQWSPEAYGNISVLYLTHRLIWQPDFILNNAVGDGSSPMGKARVVVTSSGKVTWSPPVNLLSRCGLDLSMWPLDDHTCEVQLGLFANKKSVHINMSKNLTQFQLQSGSREWEIISLFAETTSVMRMLGEEDAIDNLDDQDLDNRKTALVLTVSLKRQSYSYNILFLMPIFVIMTVCFTSFWIPAIGNERLCLLSSVLILLVIFLLAIDQTIPTLPKTTPYLLSLYSKALMMTTFAITGTIIVIILLKMDSIVSPPLVVCRLLTSPITRQIFRLSEEENYGLFMNQETSSSTDHQEVKTINHWKTIALIIDRIIFSVTTIAFAFTLFI